MGKFGPDINTELENLFTYHAPTVEQTARYETIRQAALAFARILVDATPQSAGRSAAIRYIRNAVFTANAAIACGKKE